MNFDHDLFKSPPIYNSLLLLQWVALGLLENSSPCLLAWLDRFYSCAVNSIQPWILQHIFVSSMLFLSFCFSHMMKLRMWMWKGVKGRNTKEGSEEEFLWFNGTKKWYIWENTYIGGIPAGWKMYLERRRCAGAEAGNTCKNQIVKCFVCHAKDFELHP